MTEDTLPIGWARARLDEIAVVRLGRQRSPKNHTGLQMRPYLRAANLTWDGIDVTDVKEMNFTDDEVAVYRLRPGDVLLSEASGSAKEVGKPGIWAGQLPGDVCFQNTLLRVRPEVGMQSRFLYYRLLHENLRGGFAESSRGVGIHHLGAAKLNALVIAVPPTGEQQRISDILDAFWTQFNAVTDQVRILVGEVAITPASKLGQIRRSVLTAAMGGRLVPQDPGDEPAELLLKRIAEVRAAAAPTARTRRRGTLTRARGSRRTPTEETA